MARLIFTCMEYYLSDSSWALASSSNVPSQLFELHALFAIDVSLLVDFSRDMVGVEFACRLIPRLLFPMSYDYARHGSTPLMVGKMLLLSWLIFIR